MLASMLQCIADEGVLKVPAVCYVAVNNEQAFLVRLLTKLVNNEMHFRKEWKERTFYLKQKKIASNAFKKVMLKSLYVNFMLSSWKFFALPNNLRNK